jgi:hypothetical protein
MPAKAKKRPTKTKHKKVDPKKRQFMHDLSISQCVAGAVLVLIAIVPADKYHFFALIGLLVIATGINNLVIAKKH